MPKRQHQYCKTLSTAMFLLGDIYRRKYQKYKTVTNARNHVGSKHRSGNWYISQDVCMMITIFTLSYPMSPRGRDICLHATPWRRRDNRCTWCFWRWQKHTCEHAPCDMVIYLRSYKLIKKISINGEGGSDEMRPARAVISLLHFYALIVYALSMVKHQTTKYLLYKLYLCYTFCSNNLFIFDRRDDDNCDSLFLLKMSAHNA